jgi:hypothetical protein
MIVDGLSILRRVPTGLGFSADGEAFWRRFGWMMVLALLAGCSAATSRPVAPTSGRASIPAAPVVLPAQLMGNFLLVEGKGDRAGPTRFLVDTGSSVTLISPGLARRMQVRESAANAPRVRVAGADGAVSELPRATLRRLDLGEARFDDVDVLLYDCAALSAHLGVRVDGVLGFPLFREMQLTLDYPGRRVVLQRALDAPPPAGTVVPFDDARKTPLVTVRLGDRSLVALIDSGSDAWFSLNPVGVAPVYAAGPVVGATVGTISGDHTQRIGRLAEDLAIGDHVFQRPIVDLTDELSSIGGAMLRQFVVTFDQRRDRVIFAREGTGPMVTPALRSAGLSFSKTPAYWRVAGVVPQSSAEVAGIRPGDLVTRINGEPVSKWDFARYEGLIANATELVFSFLNGSSEGEKRVRVFDLIP